MALQQDLDISSLDLTCDDRDPQAVFDAAVTKLQSVLPAFVARNGSVEVAVLEAIATAVSDFIYAVNRMPGLVVEGILGLYGVTRSPGVSATGTVTLAFDMARSLTIAAGQRLAIPSSGLILVTTGSTVVTSQSTVTVAVATQSASGSANGTAIGTALDVIDAIPFVISATTASVITGGVDPETDDTFLARAQAVFGTVTSSLAIPSNFSAYALLDARVQRAIAYNAYDGDSHPPPTTPGSDPGHVTVATYGQGGQVDNTVQAAIKTQMQAKALAILTVHTLQAQLTTINITANVKALAGYDTLAVKAACVAAINAYVNPATWVWDASFIPANLISVLSKVAGVDVVNSVTPNTTTTLTTPAGLAIAGTVAVTVV